MRWTPRALLPLAVGLFIVLAAGIAQAFPASTPDNTAMVDFPGAGAGSNAVAVRTIAQSGSNIWVGGRFTEIDDGNGNFVQAAANLAAFDATSGLVAPGVHIPSITSSVGDPEVYDSSMGPDGNLYFAGNFDSVDGQTRHNVAAINATTGVLASFAPNAASANSVLATASAVYVGTGKLLSFQLNGAPTPGYTAPTAIIDAGIRAHSTLPQFRDIQLQGNTLVAACQCDSLSDANGTRTVKAVVEIDAASGNWVNWRPSGLDDSSAAFGINVIVHALPGTGAPTVYLAAGGSDFTAAYDFSSGAQVFKTDTSGSSQAITWYQGTLVIGGHFDWSNSPTGNNQCGDNGTPNTACYHTPKLVSMSATTGAVLLNGANPWNPGICCKYNGVWALLTGNDGSTLHVGGEFTQVGGTWSGSGTNWTLSGFSRQKFYARLSGPTSTLVPLTVQKTSAAGATGSVTSAPSGINCDVNCSSSGPTEFSKNATVTLSATASAGNTFTGWSSADSGFNCPGTGDCTVTMDQARTVVANFAGISYQLDVSKTGAGTGTVTSSPAGIACGATCSSFFAQNSVVTLTATPGPNSSFATGAGWSGGGCSGTGTCVVTMIAATSVTADFKSTSQTLTVVRTTGATGLGQGTITSSPTGISCPSACVKTFNVGTVTLTATAAGGSAFNGWSGGGCSGLTPTCVVTMDSAKTVTGDFEKARALALTVAGTGGGTVTSEPPGLSCSASCSHGFPQGSTITLTATPDATSVFTGWSGTGGCTGTASCVLTMTTVTADRAATATFQPAQTLTVTPAGSGGGTVTSDLSGINCGTACSANYLPGTVVTLSAAADVNSNFANWSGDCTGTGTCVVTLDQARNVTATFTLVQRTLTVSVIGQGTVTDTPGPINCVGPVPDTGPCSGMYQHGTDVQLVATPVANWSLTGWSGACSGTDICVVSMIAAESVTATFEPINRTVTVTKDGSGTGLVTSDVSGINCGDDCAEGYNQGASVTLSAAADPGSTFTGWGGACGGTGTCVLTIDATKNVTASFELLHTLTVATNGSGTVTSDVGGISCPSSCVAANRTHNTHVILTAVPGADSAFAGWSGGGCSGTALTCDVTMDSDITVTASFGPTVTLTVTMGGTGTGTVTTPPNNEINCPSTCTHDFAQNASVTMHAVAGGTSVFVGWDSASSGFTCSSTGDCTVTMDVAKTVNATFNSTGGGTTTLKDNDPAVAYNGWFGVADSAANGGFYRMSHVKNDKATWKSPVTTSITWVTRTGPDQGKASVTIDGTNKGTVDLYSPAPGTLNKVYSGLTSNVHTIVIKVLLAQNISSSGFNVILDAFIVGATTTQESATKITYDTWKGVVQAKATDGAYRSATAATATVTVTFTGTSIDWKTTKGPAYGKASVTIDGASKGTVDMYQATTAWQSLISYGGLFSGSHTMVIQVLGQKNASATSTKVVVDGFIVHA